MVLKLYGIYRSPWVRLVAAVLFEKEVPFELVSVDLANGEHKLPEHLAKHPFGQVPCIDDEGFILYESRAISYYLASKYANQGIPLLPTGIQANALYQQAVFVELSHFHHYGVLAVREIRGKQKQGLTPDKEVFEGYMAELSVKLEVYDKILSKQKYLLGDEISLVDFFHLPVGTHFGKWGSNVLELKPNVARWFKDISSRKSWVSTEPEVKN